MVRLVAIVLGALVAAAGAGRTVAPAPAPTHEVLRFVDHTRVARYRNGRTSARTLVTDVRVPASGRAPFPLVVFGHGFAVTPALYAPLLDAWARAGYVVAAPLFPVENANAPGGPDESDLVNQPRDMSFVLTRLLAASASAGGPLHGLVDPARVAVAGQSDGAETALAVAVDPRFRDRRVRAALVLSGAELPGGPLEFAAGTPPLLAVQGTADRINPPVDTQILFRRARRPKFLLALLGAGHLPPYTTNARERAVVERVTIAFLDRYLGHGSLSGLRAAARAPGLARLTADP